MVGPEGSGKLTAILVADLAGYSRLNALINSDERLTGDAREKAQIDVAHRITSSARRRIDSGIVMPKFFAVLRLITNS